jgi:hypothetical protein
MTLYLLWYLQSFLIHEKNVPPVFYQCDEKNLILFKAFQKSFLCFLFYSIKNSIIRQIGQFPLVSFQISVPDIFHPVVGFPLITGL